ncbi:MAG TPA: cytochrome c [Polyangiaceae bacterium]|nr:cytochrome c [Polyangiaceae bacterium]
MFFPACLLLTLACNERPSDLREWKPSDHAQEESPNAAAQQNQVDPTKEAANAIPGLEDVTIVAWQQNCTQCHGQLGRGDGPRGPMLKATNLSDPAWQSARTDEQIAQVIKLGKGLMPSFQQLPDVTIAKLVMLVRMMNVARLQAHAAAAASASAAAVAAPAASGGAAPHASATPKATAAAPKASAGP